MESSTPNSLDDKDAERYLTLLREGSPTEKVEARDRLGAIFERRGLLDEAAQAYETNIREGVRDPDLYERLASVYRQQGRTELADEVLQEAGRLAEATHGGDDLEAPTRPMPSAADVGEQSSRLDDRATAPLSRPRGATRARPLDQTGPPRRPWYAATGVIILSLLICGPLGLILMWARATWSTGTKLLVTAVSLGAISLLGSLGVRAAIDSLGVLPGQAPPTVVATPTLTVPTPFIMVGGPSPSPSPGVAAPPPTPGPSPPSAAPKPAASPSPALERVRVANTEGEGANLRERPSGSATRLKNLAEGTLLDVTGPNQQGEGRTWRPVRDPTGATGWVVADFLGPP
ncbi:MAG: hypothetical protein H0V51_03070 [Chloroflexi bacterium]|nr:hypothetical protein [Chloroflexota bacterium]